MSALLEDPTPRPVLRFLGRTEVARYLGMKSIRSLSGVELPPHDAEIGDRKGWMPATIDKWAASRPGKGRWGARVGHLRTGMPVPTQAVSGDSLGRSRNTKVPEVDPPD